MALLEINWRPSNRDLRLFAAAQLILFCVIGWWLHRRLEWEGFAAALVGMSCLLLIAGLIRPRLLRLPFLAWMLAAFPMGWLMSHVLLAAVYYGIVTPIAFYLRLRGHDPLHLRPRPEAKTYWVDRKAAFRMARYFRQY